jgi:hypothetical protein
MYETCPSCAADRLPADDGSIDDECLAAALRCHDCKGTGIVRDPSSFRCNRCGGSLAGDTEPGTREQYGLVETTVRGGYSSPHLSDCTSYCFSLCEKCLRRLFSTFEIPPTVGGYSAGTGEPDGSSEPYADDDRAYRYRLWKKAGGHIEKLKLGNCNAIIDCEKAATLRKFCSGSLTNDCSCDEHGPLHTYANTWTVPFAELAGIVDGETMTIDDKRRVASVWLRASSMGDEVITYHKHAADCVQELLDDAIDGNVTSMLWVPAFVGRNGEPRALASAGVDGVQKRVEFPDGMLLLGPIKGLAPALKLPFVLAAKILPNLPERERDED